MNPLQSPVSEDELGAPPLSEINITPLVDVMLVLLIIFMVAAPLMTVGVPLQLPKTAAPKVSQPKNPVVISIDEMGQPFLDKEPLHPDALMPRLRQLASVDPNQIVLVRGDKAVPYGRIVEIMGLISAAGFTKVSLIAQAPSGPSAR